MPENNVETIGLRQPFSQRFPGFPAVFGAAYAKCEIDSHADFEFRDERRWCFDARRTTLNGASPLLP